MIGIFAVAIALFSLCTTIVGLIVGDGIVHRISQIIDHEDGAGLRSEISSLDWWERYRSGDHPTVSRPGLGEIKEWPVRSDYDRGGSDLLCMVARQAGAWSLEPRLQRILGECP